MKHEHLLKEEVEGVYLLRIDKDLAKKYQDKYYPGDVQAFIEGQLKSHRETYEMALGLRKE